MIFKSDTAPDHLCLIIIIIKTKQKRKITEK